VTHELISNEIDFKLVDKQKLVKYADEYPGTVRSTLIHSFALNILRLECQL